MTESEKKEDYKVGDYVTLKKENRTGFIRYIGKVEGLAASEMYGIELDNSIGDAGNNGSINDAVYFQCDDTKGTFVSKNRIKCKSVPPKSKDNSHNNNNDKGDTNDNQNDKENNGNNDGDNESTETPNDNDNENNTDDKTPAESSKSNGNTKRDSTKKITKGGKKTKKGDKKKKKNKLDAKKPNKRSKSPQPKQNKLKIKGNNTSKTSKKGTAKSKKTRSKLEFPKSANNFEKINFICANLKDTKPSWKDRKSLVSKLKEILDDKKVDDGVIASAVEKFKKPFSEQMGDKKMAVRTECLLAVQSMCNHSKQFKKFAPFYAKKCLEALKSADAKSASAVVNCVNYIIKKTPKKQTSTIIAELIRGTTSRNKLIRKHSWQFICQVLKNYTDPAKKKSKAKGKSDKPSKQVMDVIGTGLKTGLSDKDRSIQHEAMNCLNFFSLVDEARGEKIMSKLTPSARKVYMGKYPTKRKTSVLLDANKLKKLKIREKKSPKPKTQNKKDLKKTGKRSSVKNFKTDIKNKKNGGTKKNGIKTPKTDRKKDIKKGGKKGDKKGGKKDTKKGGKKDGKTKTGKDTKNKTDKSKTDKDDDDVKGDTPTKDDENNDDHNDNESNENGDTNDNDNDGDDDGDKDGNEPKSNGIQNYGHEILDPNAILKELDKDIDLKELDDDVPKKRQRSRNEKSFNGNLGFQPADLFDPKGELGGYDDPNENDDEDPNAPKHNKPKDDDSDDDDDQDIDDLLNDVASKDDIFDPETPKTETTRSTYGDGDNIDDNGDDNNNNVSKGGDDDDDEDDSDARDLIESFLDLKDPQINWKMIEFLSKDNMTHLLMSYISRMPGGPKFWKGKLDIDVNEKIPETLPLYSEEEDEIRATQLSYSLMRILSNEHAAETVKSFLLRKCPDICTHALAVFHPNSKGNVYHGRVVLEILLNHWPKSFMGALTNNPAIKVLLKIALFRNLHQGNLNSFFLDLICYRPQQNNKIGQIQPVKKNLITMFNNWKFMEYLLNAATLAKHGDDVATKYSTFFIDMVARCASIPEASELFLGYENLIIDSFMNGLLNNDGSRTLWHRISCGQTLVQFLDISSRPTIVDPAQAMAGMLGVVPPEPNPNVLHPMFDKSLKRLHEYIPKMCAKICEDMDLEPIKLANGTVKNPFGQVKLNCLELLTVSADFAQFQCGDVLNMLEKDFWGKILDMAFTHNNNNMFLCHFRRLIHLSMIFRRRFLKHLFVKCNMLEKFIEFYHETKVRCTLHGYVLQMLWDIYNHDQRDDEQNMDDDNDNNNNNNNNDDDDDDEDDKASTGSLIVNEDVDEDGNPLSPQSKPKQKEIVDSDLDLNNNNINDNNNNEEFTEEDLILRPNFSKDPLDQWDIVTFFDNNKTWLEFLIPLTEQMELQNNAEQQVPNHNTQGQDQLNDLLKTLLTTTDEDNDDNDSTDSSDSSDDDDDE